MPIKPPLWILQKTPKIQDSPPNVRAPLHGSTAELGLEFALVPHLYSCHTEPVEGNAKTLATDRKASTFCFFFLLLLNSST